MGLKNEPEAQDCSRASGFFYAAVLSTAAWLGLLFDFVIVRLFIITSGH